MPSASPRGGAFALLQRLGILEELPDDVRLAPESSVAGASSSGLRDIAELEALPLDQADAFGTDMALDAVVERRLQAERDAIRLQVEAEVRDQLVGELLDQKRDLEIELAQQREHLVARLEEVESRMERMQERLQSSEHAAREARRQALQLEHQLMQERTRPRDPESDTARGQVVTLRSGDEQRVAAPALDKAGQDRAAALARAALMGDGAISASVRTGDDGGKTRKASLGGLWPKR